MYLVVVRVVVVQLKLVMGEFRAMELFLLQKKLTLGHIDIGCSHMLYDGILGSKRPRYLTDLPRPL